MTSGMRRTKSNKLIDNVQQQRGRAKAHAKSFVDSGSKLYKSQSVLKMGMGFGQQARQKNLPTDLVADILKNRL